LEKSQKFTSEWKIRPTNRPISDIDRFHLPEFRELKRNWVRMGFEEKYKRFSVGEIYRK
jgi:hypothetical protein